MKVYARMSNGDVRIIDRKFGESAAEVAKAISGGGSLTGSAVQFIPTQDGKQIRVDNIRELYER